MISAVGGGRSGHPEKILLEGVTRKLSLVVYLVDEYSNKGITDDLEVSLKDQNMAPVRTIGGYYIFFDLPDSSYTVQARGERIISVKLWRRYSLPIWMHEILPYRSR